MADKSYLARAGERGMAQVKAWKKGIAIPASATGALLATGLVSAVGEPVAKAVAWTAEKAAGAADAVYHWTASLPPEVTFGGAAAGAAITAIAAAKGARQEPMIGKEQLATRSAKLQEGLTTGQRVSAVGAFRTARAANKHQKNDAIDAKRAGTPAKNQKLSRQDRQPSRGPGARDQGGR